MKTTHTFTERVNKERTAENIHTYNGVKEESKAEHVADRTPSGKKTIAPLPCAGRVEGEGYTC